MKNMGGFRPFVVTVGNELIYGERMDENKQWMLAELWKIGMTASAALSIPDEEGTIAFWINLLKENRFFPIIVSGGIGSTHDDKTREGVAMGLNRKLVLHEECFEILKNKYKNGFTKGRQKMAWLPEGAKLIPNPLGAPGFMVENVFCFPGFPQMLRPMFIWVLEKELGIKSSCNFVVKEWKLEVSEGVVAERIGAFADEHEDLSIGLYPHIVEGYKQELTVRARTLKNQAHVLDELERLLFEEIQRVR